MSDFLKPRQVDRVKRSFPKGTRIKLKEMFNESDLPFWFFRRINA